MTFLANFPQASRELGCSAVYIAQAAECYILAGGTLESAIFAARSSASGRVHGLLRRFVARHRRKKAIAFRHNQSRTLLTLRRCVLLWKARRDAQVDLRRALRVFRALKRHFTAVRAGHGRFPCCCPRSRAAILVVTGGVCPYGNSVPRDRRNCRERLTPVVCRLLLVRLQLQIVRDRFRICFWPLRTWRKYTSSAQVCRQKALTLTKIWDTLQQVHVSAGPSTPSWVLGSFPLAPTAPLLL